MTCTVLSASHVLPHLIFFKNLDKTGTIIISISWTENWGTEKLCDFPKVIQTVTDKTRISM